MRLLFVVSVQSLRSTLILLLPWLTTRSPITVNGSPLKEDATHPNFFVGSDTTVSQFVELCDAQAESVTRRRTMGVRVAGGQAKT